MIYSNQLIIALVPGGPDSDEDNRIVVRNARALSVKRQLAGEGERTELRIVSENGIPDLSRLEGLIQDNTRVYLVGHGDRTSSSLSGLNAAHLARMIRTLVASPRRIRRLGLVGCYSGMSNLRTGGPPHSLAVALFDLLRERVEEVTGYTGPTGVLRQNRASPEPGDVATDYGQGTVYAAGRTGHKDVVQQTRDSGGRIPRKIIVTARGRAWMGE